MKGNEPAFPIESQGVPGSQSWLAGARGLTKREYFAGLAMQAHTYGWTTDGSIHAKHVAEMSVEYADALLAELSKEQK